MNLLTRMLRGQPDEISRYTVQDYIRQLTQQGFGLLNGGLTYPSTSYSRGKPAERIENSYVGYVYGAYKVNPIIYGLMQVRSSVFSQARLMWRRRIDGKAGDLFWDEELRVLERPWPNGSTSELLARMIQDVDLAGNSYVVNEGDRLRRLRPDWVSIVLSGNPLEDVDVDVLGYYYAPGGPENGNGVSYLPDEMCHWSPDPDPIAVYRGQSWLTPVVREIMADQAATQHKLNFFQNGATLGPIFRLPKEMTADQFRKFKEVSDQGHAGVENAYRPMYVGGGADVTLSAATLQQLDFSSTQGAGEVRLCVAAGVPAPIAGVSEGMKGSPLNSGNFGVARRLFGDLEARRLLQSACVALSSIVNVPDQSELWFDTADIAFFHEDQQDAANIAQTQMATIVSGVTGGFDQESTVLAVAPQWKGVLQPSGYTSVQLQPAPGSPNYRPPSAPGAAPAPDVTAVQARAIAVLADTIDRAYNPTQPRIDAGHPHGGRWGSLVSSQKHVMTPDEITAEFGEELDRQDFAPDACVVAHDSGQVTVQFDTGQGVDVFAADHAEQAQAWADHLGSFVDDPEQDPAVDNGLYVGADEHGDIQVRWVGDQVRTQDVTDPDAFDGPDLTPDEADQMAQALDAMAQLAQDDEQTEPTPDDETAEGETARADLDPDDDELERRNVAGELRVGKGHSTGGQFSAHVVPAIEKAIKDALGGHGNPFADENGKPFSRAQLVQYAKTRGITVPPRMPINALKQAIWAHHGGGEHPHVPPAPTRAAKKVRGVAPTDVAIEDASDGDLRVSVAGQVLGYIKTRNGRPQRYESYDRRADVPLYPDDRERSIAEVQRLVAARKTLSEVTSSLSGSHERSRTSTTAVKGWHNISPGWMVEAGTDGAVHVRHQGRGSGGAGRQFENSAGHAEQLAKYRATLESRGFHVETDPAGELLVTKGRGTPDVSSAPVKKAAAAPRKAAKAVPTPAAKGTLDEPTRIGLVNLRATGGARPTTPEHRQRLEALRQRGFAREVAGNYTLTQAGADALGAHEDATQPPAKKATAKLTPAQAERELGRDPEKWVKAAEDGRVSRPQAARRLRAMAQRVADYGSYDEHYAKAAAAEGVPAHPETLAGVEDSRARVAHLRALADRVESGGRPAAPRKAAKAVPTPAAKGSPEEVHQARTVADLKQIAQERGIRLPAGLKKEQIRQHILNPPTVPANAASKLTPAQERRRFIDDLAYQHSMPAFGEPAVVHELRGGHPDLVAMRQRADVAEGEAKGAARRGDDIAAARFQRTADLLRKAADAVEEYDRTHAPAPRKAAKAAPSPAEEQIREHILSGGHTPPPRVRSTEPASTPTTGSLHGQLHAQALDGRLAAWKRGDPVGTPDDPFHGMTVSVPDLRRIAAAEGVDVPKGRTTRKALTAAIVGAVHPSGDRQAKLDQARPVAEALADVEQVINDGGSAAAIQARLKGHNLPADVRAELGAAAGDRQQLLGKIDEVAARYNLHRTTGRSGAIEPLDRTRHESLQPELRAGQQVQVLSPGYEVHGVDQTPVRVRHAKVMQPFTEPSGAHVPVDSAQVANPANVARDMHTAFQRAGGGSPITYHANNALKDADAAIRRGDSPATIAAALREQAATLKREPLSERDVMDRVGRTAAERRDLRNIEADGLRAAADAVERHAPSSEAGVGQRPGEVINAAHEQAVRDAYRKLARRSDAEVSLADLRRELAAQGLKDRADQDEAIRRMARRSARDPNATDVHLVPEERRALITPQMRDAGINIGGQDYHYLAIRGAEPTRGGTPVTVQAQERLARLQSLTHANKPAARAYLNDLTPTELADLAAAAGVPSGTRDETIQAILAELFRSRADGNEIERADPDDEADGDDDAG